MNTASTTGGSTTKKSLTVAPRVLEAQRHIQLTAKWGAMEVKGLDGKRAEAIGLEPLCKNAKEKPGQIGYASLSQVLPPVLQETGTAARYCRRLAELCLQNCERWREIEANCRETNEHYRELLVMSRVREEAYRTAADILTKIEKRPGLLAVWELSCPGLLRSKTRELELQQEGTPVYLETLKEKMRIDLIYDAVADLKKIEDERPIRASDIAVKQRAVAALASTEQEKIMAQEKALAEELKEIGDGSDHVVKFEGMVQMCMPTSQLTLKKIDLLALPPMTFQLTHLELLDVSHNSISELPAEVSELGVLKKLYVDHNKLTTLPTSLHKLSNHLTLLAGADNPFEPELNQMYLSGLPVLMGYLKHVRKSKSRPEHNAAGIAPDMPYDLYSLTTNAAAATTKLPAYTAGEHPPMPQPTHYASQRGPLSMDRNRMDEAVV